jgi:hypothetical protein
VTPKPPPVGASSGLSGTHPDDLSEFASPDFGDDLAHLESDLLSDAASPALSAVVVSDRDAKLANGCARVGLGAVVVSVAAIGLLHVLPPTDRLDPLSRTISEYALLPDGWVFDAAVLLLSAGSAVVLVALLLRRLVAWRSFGALMIAVWCLGLIGLILFPKHGFGADNTFGGRVHWTWTLIAFFSLPIGTTLMCWSARLPGARWPRWALRLSTISGGWFLVLTTQTVLSAATPIQAWRAVGLVERALSLTEMAVVVVLAVWVLHECRPPSSPLDVS